MSQDELYELNLAFTLKVNVSVALILLVSLNFFGFLFPKIFRTFELSGETLKSVILWPFDVIAHPLSDYAKKGNLVVAYVYFIRQYFWLIVRITCYAVTLELFYASGNSQLEPKLTVLSNFIILNINRESYGFIIIPIIAVFICAEVVKFYEKFTEVYIDFKQRCLLRKVPSNYVLLATNIPEEEYFRLFETFPDIISVVPIPNKEQQEEFSDFCDIDEELQQILLKIELIEAKLVAKPKVSKYLPFLSVKLIQFIEKYIEKMLFMNELFLRYYHEKLLKLKIEKLKLFKEIKCRLYLTQQHTCGLTSDVCEIMKEPESEEANYKVVNNVICSNSAFLVCESEVSMSEKIALQVTPDKYEPYLEPAPYYKDIDWKSLSRMNGKDTLNKLLLMVNVSIVFVIYFVLESYANSLINNKGNEWIEIVEDKICDTSDYCTLIITNVLSYLLGLVPTIFAIILPWMINLALIPALLPSRTAVNALTYRVIFFILIIANGVLQIAFPAAIDPETGNFDLSFLFSANVSTVIENIGDNIPKQIYLFINFLLTKYMLEAALLVVGTDDIWTALSYCVHNRFNRVKVFKQKEFDYEIALANRLHMFTISVMYFIISPLAFEFVLLIEVFSEICEQYVLLNKIPATSVNEISPGKDIIQLALDDIFHASYYMLLCTFCFCLTYGNIILKWSSIVFFVLLIIMICKKQEFDKHYGNSGQELATGNILFKPEKFELPISYICNNGEEPIVIMLENNNFGNQEIVSQNDINETVACYCHPASFIALQ